MYKGSSTDGYPFTADTIEELRKACRRDGKTLDESTIEKYTPPPKPTNFSSAQSGVTLRLYWEYLVEQMDSKHTMGEFLQALHRKFTFTGGDFATWVAGIEGFKILNAMDEKDFKQPAEILAKDPRIKQILSSLDPLFLNEVASWPPLTDAKREVAAAKLLHGLRVGVKYVEETSVRVKYEIELGPQLRRRNKPFDTLELQTHFSQKGNYSVGQVIWVMGVDGNFYSHIAKIGRIHHSSFTAGGDLYAAGDWVVDAGKLKHINGQSGHYKPGMQHFEQALRKLKEKNVFNDTDKIIQVWHKQSGDPYNLSYPEFLMNKGDFEPWDVKRKGFFGTA